MSKLMQSILAFNFSVGLATAILLGSQLIPQWGEWYSTHVTARWETKAIREGHWAVSSNPAALARDSVWDNGRVQQAWGVGVPLWRAIPETFTRWLGATAFPDRFAFGILLVVVIYVTTTFPLQGILEATGPWVLPGWLCPFFTVLFPPFLALLSSGLVFYEEIVAYAYLAAVLLMLGTIRLWCRPSLRGYAVLAFASGFIPFIRPTFGVYGVASVLVAGFAVGRDRGRIRTFCLGGALFCVGLALLCWSNASRFGSPWEFGHALNLNEINPMRYAARFDHPYRLEPIGSAARELFGVLFMAPASGTDCYAAGLFPGQSPTFRWREIMFTTYDLSIAVAAVLVWGWSMVRAGSLWRAEEKSPALRIAKPLAWWSLLSVCPLLLFYLRWPFISSRYLLDFGPAFGAASWGAAWLAVDFTASIGRANWRKWGLLAVVGIWWGLELSRIKVQGQGFATDREGMMARMRLQSDAATRQISIPLVYTNGFDFSATSIPFNGSGWERTAANVSIALFVENPDCVILDVAPALHAQPEDADYDCIRAKIGLEFLERQSITSIAGGKRIFFSGPKRTRYQKGIQVVFLGMVCPEQLSTAESRFSLLKVNWRRDRQL